MLPLKVGDRVAKGQLLAELDTRDFEVRVRSTDCAVVKAQAQLTAMKTGARPEEIIQLEAALNKAKADREAAKLEYERNAKLHLTQTVATSEVDRAFRFYEAGKASVEHAEQAFRIGHKGARKEEIDAKNAEIESLKAAALDAKHQLEDTKLKAPFTGDVATVYVEAFQNVTAKEPIIRLLDTSHIEMTVDVPETVIHVVPQVKNVVVRVAPFGAREFAAKIKEIGTEASRATGTFPVTLIMDQPEDVRILPGMTGEAQARDRTPDGE